MSMIASSSHSDLDSKSLQALLEAFGSRFSLEDIAAAYCKAKQNVDVAGEILFAMAEKTEEVKMNEAISKPTHVYVPKEVRRQEDNNAAKVQRPKKKSVSAGTITNVIDKEYVRARPTSDAPRETTKPVKIDSKDIPETEIWSEEMPERKEAEISRASTKVEEFIVQMLGEGFQASEEVIHEILSVCGYDVKKSTEKLLDLSDATNYADVGTPSDVMSKVDTQRQGSTSVELQKFSQSEGVRTLTALQDADKDRTGLEKEVLEALFSGAERYEEKPKINRRVGERRAGVAGRPVFKPLEEPFQERVVTVKLLSRTSKEDEDDEREFKTLRRAVHENRNEMKQYITAAIEAFNKGETERVRRLVEKGYFSGQKAREADDKSAKMLEDKKDSDSSYKEDEVVTVNAKELEPKGALRLLKVQLKTFSGTPSIKYLRVQLGVNKEDSNSKKRQVAIAKLLEGESIAWSVEDNGLVMMIRVDEIDPKKLSFAKK